MKGDMPTDERLNDEAAAQLAAIPDPVPAYEVQEPPITLHTDSGIFKVTLTDAWAYMDAGIYASGSWSNSDEAKDVLIPYERIQYIEFDFSDNEAVQAAVARDAEAAA